MLEWMYRSMKDIFCVSEYLLQDVSARLKSGCRLVFILRVILSD